jgi:membrane-anchored mycosin MYCP
MAIPRRLARACGRLDADRVPGREDGRVHRRSQAVAGAVLVGCLGLAAPALATTAPPTTTAPPASSATSVPVATTQLPADGSVPIPPEGTRPLDPDAKCQGSGPDIVDLPAAQRRLGAEDIWGLSKGGGVLVAVVGSGVDATNAQLVGQVERGIDVVFPGAYGDADCVGQGTVIAGLIAARVRPDIGFHGIAPNSKILPVRVTLDGLDTTPDLLAAGIDAAVSAGASVVLVALPSEVGTARLVEAVEAAEAAGVVVVAPADALPEGVPGYSYPATYDTVLAVSALDADGVPAAAGTGEDAVIDLVAPGEGVVGPLPGGGHTVAVTGTLPAAAYVAGVAALVRAAYPDLGPAEVRRRLELTADHPGRPVPDLSAGWGVVDPVVAVSAEVATTPRQPAAEPLEAVGGPQPPPAPDRSTEHLALWFALGGALAAIALLVGVKVVPNGRERGWRPGRAKSPAPNTPA